MNNTNKKSAFLTKADFRLAGAGGLEPATHGFGVASKCRKALKILPFPHISRHFPRKTMCCNCVWKFLMLFWWYDKILAYILAANVLLMLLKFWGAINKEKQFPFDKNQIYLLACKLKSSAYFPFCFSSLKCEPCSMIWPSPITRILSARVVFERRCEIVTELFPSLKW